MSNNAPIPPIRLAQIYSDHWQESGDKTGKDGKDSNHLAFETAGLAKTLAQLAWNPANTTPFTVDIRGGWGRGKTTLLRETQRLLDGKEHPGNSRKVTTLWLNVWKYPSEDTVLAGMLGALLEKFKTDDWKKQLIGLLNAYKGTVGLAVLRMAAPWLPEKLPGLLKADPIPGTSDAITRKRAFHDEFEPLFCHLAHLYLFPSDAVKASDKSSRELWKKQSSKGVLAIFLDDLDRCNEERVMQVLEAINLFFDMPGVCFYLGIDFERLQAILQKKMGDDPERATAFLEKIIQISLPLPDVSDEGAKEYLHSLITGNPWLKKVINDDTESISKILENRNPRHIKRFLNDLSLRLALLQNTEKLGDESPKVPGNAVLAWHLFHEAMPAEAKNAARLLSNFEGFLRRWESTQQTLRQNDENRENIGKEELRHHEHGWLTKHIEILGKLTVEQKKTLLHLASPDGMQNQRLQSGVGEGGAAIEWVNIPAGSFTMGSNDFDDAKPVHRASIDHDFKMAKYPITNSQYKRYLTEAMKNYFPKHWENGAIPSGKENHPVVYVSWHDALAYCEWLGKRLGQEHTVRLPTEAEWEYVAAGDGERPRKYPWGDEEPNSSLANFNMQVGDTTPVGDYPKGNTPSGVSDLAGNVWEWTASKDEKYPYTETDERNSLSGNSPRVLRGGGFFDDQDGLRCAYRVGDRPDFRNDNVGFRVVLSPFSKSEPLKTLPSEAL